MTIWDKALGFVWVLVALGCVAILVEIPFIVAARKHEQQVRCISASAPSLIISE